MSSPPAPPPSGTVADVLAQAPPAEHSPTLIDDVRADIDEGLARALHGWDRPGPTLRITKRRAEVTERCPAQLLADADGVELSAPIVLGHLLDAAMSVLSMSVAAPYTSSWFHELARTVSVGDDEIARFLNRLDGPAESDLRNRTETRAAGLKSVLGDITALPSVAQDSIAVPFDTADVVLTGRIDLSIAAERRALVEVKSGKMHRSLYAELDHYALIDGLRNRRPADLVIGITLDPEPIVHSFPIDAAMVQRAAARVVRAAERLRAVDEAVLGQRWPPTSPGGHCSWCPLADRCPDISDVDRAAAEDRTWADAAEDGEELEPW